jgi:hypothetical protein
VAGTVSSASGLAGFVVPIPSDLERRLHKMDNFKEKDLEEYILEHPGRLIPGLVPLAHQVKLPDGIADIVGTGYEGNGPDDGNFHDYAENFFLYVIELKIHRLKEENVGQVLRYVSNIKAYLDALGDSDDAHLRVAPFIAEHVIPVLVGLKGTDQKVLSAADGGGVRVIEFEFRKDRIRFSPAFPEPNLSDQVPTEINLFVTLYNKSTIMDRFIRSMLPPMTFNTHDPHKMDPNLSNEEKAMWGIESLMYGGQVLDRKR